MDCFKAECNHYSIEKSKYYASDYCTISGTCPVNGCPIDSMIRYTEDRLEGLQQIKRYLEGLR